MKRRRFCLDVLLMGTLLLIPTLSMGAQATSGELRILTPLDGARVEPGQPFSVVVEPEAGVTPKIVGIMAPQMIVVLKKAPPFTFSVSFPLDAPLGPAGLFADGRDARDRLLRGGITLNVETSTPVTSIRVDPTEIFFSRTREDTLSVKGTFTDGQTRIITKSREIQYASSDPQVATVTTDGLVKAVGEGTATVTITYKGKSVTVPVKVEFQRQSIKIDIRPGDSNNRINLDSGGSIPVAILTTNTFDVTRVDPLSVRFGPNAVMEEHGRGHFEDVDRDGFSDMVLHFRIQETGIACHQTLVTLTGSTIDGVLIKGTDFIRPRGNNCIEIPHR